MKTKLLFLFAFIITTANTYSQTEVSPYVENLIEPNRMVTDGTDLYVQGYENLYVIDTSAPTPTATLIYTPELNFSMYNLTISGNTLYMTEENYNESTGVFLGSRIVALDLNNLANPVDVVYSTGEFINALTISGNTIYFSAETLLNPPSFDPFITHIDKIDISQPNPEPTVIVSELTDGVAQDIVLYNNDLYVSDIDNSTIHKFNATQIEPLVDNYLINLNTPRGLYVFSNELYIAENFETTKIDLDDFSADLENVAQNTTYQDVNNGMDFYANFRDVAIIGTTIYMTLHEDENGRVVKIEDSTLSVDNLTLDNITVVNSDSNISVEGLKENTNVELYGLSGQLITTKNLTPNNNNIDISNLEKGIYLLKVENSKTFKLVK